MMITNNIFDTQTELPEFHNKFISFSISSIAFHETASKWQIVTHMGIFQNFIILSIRGLECATDPLLTQLAC